MASAASGIPRLYAAASLKREHGCVRLPHRAVRYSAALCRGLIEALSSRRE